MRAPDELYTHTKDNQTTIIRIWSIANNLQLIDVLADNQSIRYLKTDSGNRELTTADKEWLENYL